MNIENTQSQMRKGILEFCILSIIRRGEAYPSDIEEEFEQLSLKIKKYESELDTIANGLYEIQPFGYRAYDLYGLGKPVTTQEIILNLQKELEEINKNNLDDILTTIFSYGRLYSRFGDGNYPLKNRKSFTKLEIKDRLTMVEILKSIIEKAKESVEFLDHFDQDDVTPEYSLLVSNKLEKIYDDLKPEEKRTLQKLRLWWWTSFTGKNIIDELLEGDKFKGLSSKEWPKLRESLRILYELAKVSEKMSDGIKQLKPSKANG